MPPSISQELLDRLTSAYRNGGRLVFGFDYDGTLTPLVAHPDIAHLDPALRETLARLAALPQVAVGVISGRGLDNLIRMVGLSGLYYGGTCGLELDLCGERVIAAEAVAYQPLLAALNVAIASRLNRYPGAWLEQKPFGFTLHYRQLAAERIEPLCAEVADLLNPHETVLLILHGPLAIEVLPAVDRDKGTALQAIITHGGAEPVTVLYAGDAANDAPALAAAVQWQGIALGIGPEAPAEAVYSLPDPAALSDFLAALAGNLARIRSIA